MNRKPFLGSVLVLVMTAGLVASLSGHDRPPPSEAMPGWLIDFLCPGGLDDPPGMWGGCYASAANLEGRPSEPTGYLIPRWDRGEMAIDIVIDRRTRGRMTARIASLGGDELGEVREIGIPSDPGTYRIIVPAGGSGGMIALSLVTEGARGSRAPTVLVGYPDTILLEAGRAHTMTLPVSPIAQHRRMGSITLVR